MAKNFEITLQMLENEDACETGIELFKFNFGNKLVLSAPNARKAATIFNIDSWLSKLLKEIKNKYEYLDFVTISNRQWTEECKVDDHKQPNCNERGIQHRIRCYDKFIELYRAENKAPRKSRAKT